ncbi:threonylcarbamoyladenosine tRNA methylthiotransferase [Camellia sinensis]|uniref:threonylcarbamoyladenosine tRNA methylthiotransferase n=1 Tax=Camellia sinensis TaxID=4442 RepID=UPI0010368BE7|nr:threonylcarbamoyladenosine tRNA methylthiotransferase [Camellia sinensis]
MEDIEDLLVGSGGAPAGFRLPITASVSVNPKKKNQQSDLNNHSSIQPSLTASHSPKIPGTQTIYMKTFGCSHNQSDSEYMAGQLSAFGYVLGDNPEEADLWLINTCTVKSPSQSAMETLISKCRSAKKPLVVAGCVPQGSRNLKELEGVSIVGVQQIDRVVEVVEETLKGHEVRLLNRKTLPALDLPKVRKNKFIEILPINVGCLGACTYCKTKHARGHLGSYTVDSLVERVRTVITDGVKEIWLSSEDTGAYGRDIGVNLPILLKAIVAELPSDGSTMLRIGMTNPPYILEHLKDIADVLCHPCVYSFLHVPVQSGSDAVLAAMNREYTVGEFRTVVDTLTELVPGMQIATDIICGFPGETDEDFGQTVSLIDEYKLPQVHISQFYPRPGTPAARMKKVPSTVVKKRSRELTNVFESLTPYNGMEGKVERIWITEIATDGIHLVGHTKGYVQVLVIGPETILGTSAIVKITSVGRWSVFGEVIETLNQINGNIASSERKSNGNKCTPCSNLEEACACSREPEPCACEMTSCGVQNALEESTISLPKNENRSLIRWLLRKRKNQSQKRMENGIVSEIKENQEWSRGRMREWTLVDRALVGGMVVSLLTVAVLLSFFVSGSMMAN